MSVNNASLVEDSAAFKELWVGGTIKATRTGRPAYFEVKTNATMGGWFNASKSQIDLQTTG